MKNWLSVVATLVLCSCSPAEDAKQNLEETPTPRAVGKYGNWPPTLDELRFQWSAGPGIDLTTGPGVVVRAYIESFDIADRTYDVDTTYPGFFRSTPANIEWYTPGLLVQQGSIRPLGPDYPAKPADALLHFGFVPYHLLEIHSVGDGHEALVCSGEYADFISSRTHPGKYRSIATDEELGRPRYEGTKAGIHVTRIQFTQRDPRVGSDPPPSPTAPQTGTALAPTADVFGGWFITGASTLNWGPVGNPDNPKFPSPELKQRCADSMPQDESQRLALMTGFHDAPPPHGDPIPGWPQASG